MEFPDRKKLYCIHDSEGEPLYIAAETFEDAVKKYRQWQASEDPNEDIDIESVSMAGYLIVVPFQAMIPVTESK